ncbi:MAG TPA: 3-hydroxyacyl-CoA dehydrogenase NAD-binding domain-containing protein [Planctomycetota bacterium]|nr:3-hydroxyacyl-CoA dehydrogenase NAD-binding domain-containing protein [Planctomycetota bacterium]
MMSFDEKALEGLPLPPNCPETGTCIRYEQPEPGLVVLVLDPPHRKLAVLDLPLMRDLSLAITRLEDDRALRGVVITGRAPLEFALGADIDAIGTIEDPALVERFIRLGQDLFHRLHRMQNGAGRRVRTVAAVGGPVPGGAFELSLACDRILLADDPRSRIGLPETKLGILPAWGGSQRLPRRVGVTTALDAILKGTLLPARPAYSKGFVDRLTPPEYLLRTAADVALGRTSCARRGRGRLGSILIDRNPLALGVIYAMTRKTVMAQTRGRYPAAMDVAQLVCRAPLTPFSIGFAQEAQRAALLATGPVCDSLIGIFKLMEGAKKLGVLPDGSRPEPFRTGAVLGAGIMGGTIASLLAGKGIATRLFDISGEALDAAQIDHRKDLKKRLKRRRIRPNEHDSALDRLDTTGDIASLARAEIAIEAVAERMDVKREVFGTLAASLSTDAILCTNTSSLSVDAIFDGLPAPERFVGMHFFNPVRQMPLVEVVRGSETSDETVARVAALAVALGKTPVIVKDVAGFLVNRILGPYMDEALRLYDCGVAPERIDRLAEAFGMPMGPLALLDEVGIDIAAHAALSLHEAYGERMAPCTSIRGLLDEGHLGKKAGRGFYVHSGQGRKARRSISPMLATLAPPSSAEGDGLSDEQVTEQMMLAMLNEGARALEEQVCSSAAELDLATIFGMGFPPFRGGLLRWADSVGVREIVDRIERTAVRVGARPGGAARFEVAPLLAELARTGGSLHGAAD